MKKPLPLRPKNNHLKYIFIILRQNVFVHLQNLFSRKNSKISRENFKLRKMRYKQDTCDYRPQWTDTKGIQNHTGSEEKSVDVVVAFGYR